MTKMGSEKVIVLSKLKR